MAVCTGTPEISESTSMIAPEITSLNKVVAQEKRKVPGWEITFNILGSRPGERWKKIEEYPNYYVSSCGRIWSIKRKIFRKLVIDNPKSHCITLYKPGKKKKFTIKNLVMNYFIEPDTIIQKVVLDGQDMFIYGIDPEIHGKIWCTIKGYEKYYISDRGYVYSQNIKRCLKFQREEDGYEYVKLSQSGKKKKFCVHTLVGSHYLREKREKEVYDHMNKIRDHNQLSNLRVASRSENSKNTSRKRGKPVLQCDKDGIFIKRFDNATKAAKKIGQASSSYISKCCIEARDYPELSIKERKTSGGFRWEFESPEKIFIQREGEERKCVGVINGRDFSVYEVTSQGRVKNKKKNVEMSQFKCKGYFSVSLCYQENGNYKECSMRVNRLVAYVFVFGRTEERNVVHHLNNQKLENRATNLMWVTQQMNVAFSQGIPVKAIDINGKVYRYNSLGKAAKDSGIPDGDSTYKIKRYINTGESYEGYRWYLDSPLSSC